MEVDCEPIEHATTHFKAIGDARGSEESLGWHNLYVA